MKARATRVAIFAIAVSLQLALAGMCIEYFGHTRGGLGGAVVVVGIIGAASVALWCLAYTIAGDCER